MAPILRAMRSLSPLTLFTPLCLLMGALQGGCGGDSTAKHEIVTPPKVDAGVDAATDAGPDAGEAAAPRLIIEPEQGMAPIYAFISSAKKSIDMTMYEDEDPMVTSLLATAVKAGVTARVILDQNLEMSSNAPTYTALAAANVGVHWANATYAATHQKTITVDGTTSAIMTLNLTPYYYPTSREFAVLTSDPKDVAAVLATFDADYTNAAITPPQGDDLVWSPTNSQAALLAIISGAKTSLMIENEEMSYFNVIDALTVAAKAGVDVQVIMTASSEWDQAFMSLTQDGVKVVTYARDASLYIHAKVILADYGQPQASVFIGSENFSEASLTENRELGIVTTNAAILDSVHTTLTSDFAGGAAF